jgi:Matrixin
MARFAGVVAPLIFITGALAAADTPFWIAPCDDPKTACKASDADLARWALAAWEDPSGGRLRFVQTGDRSEALIRIVWAGPFGPLYGETVQIDVKARQGSQIVVYTAQYTRDALLRDSIVYLTCLHESGHALGLEHTSRSGDIMYPRRPIMSRSLYLGYSDLANYFSQYRRKLSVREDIRKNPGLWPADRQHLMEKLPAFEAR